jgi:hypothetical protein
MVMNRDFRDLFSALNAAELRYLIVGSYQDSLRHASGTALDG